MPFIFPVAAGIATVCIFVDTFFVKESKRKHDLDNQKSSKKPIDSSGYSKLTLMNGDESSIYPQKHLSHVVKKKNAPCWLVEQQIIFNSMLVAFDLIHTKDEFGHGDDYDYVSSVFATPSRSLENYNPDMSVEGILPSSLECPCPKESSLPPIFQLATQLRWKKLRCILKGKRGLDRCKERDETGLTLLGTALGYHAPLDIIQLIISIDPSQLTAIDTYGANALHIACLNGTPSASVSHVLKNCGKLASSRDKDGRVPLHHITECICRDEVEFVEGLKIICVLCRYNRAMIHAHDQSKNSPLDIVHLARNKKGLSKVETKRLVKLSWFLRKISFREYRDQKKKWEER